MDLPIPAHLSYAPIRARIQASLDPEDAEDAGVVTDICIIVSAIAHGNQHTWLRQMSPALGEKEALEWLADVQQAWPDEIAAVRQVSEQIAALCSDAGIGWREEAIVNGILHRDFFQLSE